MKSCGRQARTALEADDFHAGFAELGREDPAGRADADDDDIGLFGCHGSCPPQRGFGLRLQADDGRACERVLALHVRWREQRLRAGKARPDPAGEVLVAAVDGSANMPSIVCVRTVLKNACAVGQVKPVALPCSSAVITSSCLRGAELHERLCCRSCGNSASSAASPRR